MLSSPPPLSSNTQQLLQRPFTTTTVSGDPPQLSFASSPPPPAPPPPAAAYNPSLLIIAAILVFVVLFSAAIHLLLRLLSHPSSSSSSSSSSSTASSSSSFSSPSPPLIYHNSTTPPSSSPDMEPRTLSVDSLPLLSLAVVTATKSFSPDCAVCLSRFRPGDQLRLLPACRHVFHSPCIEAWLRSPASSCPLCRAPISIPSPPMPPPSPPPPPQPPEDAGTSVAPPGDEVAEAAGGDGRGWLKDYVDRLASSASSPFSSFRFSGRWSRRFDDAGEASLDLEDGGDSSTASCRWTLRTGAAS